MISFKKLLVGLGLTIVASMISYYAYLEYKIKTVYYIAVPTAFGEIDTSGRHTVQGMQFYIDKFMRENKINSYTLKLKVFDDNKKKPEENAAEILKIPNLLAIVGHDSSGNTFKGMEIYKNTNIPVIGPAPSHTDLSLIYPQFFHIVFRNKEQGEFIPFYTKHVFKKNKTIILRNDSAYVNDLYKYTIAQANKLQLNVVHDVTFGVEKPDHNLIKKTVDELPLSDDSVVILLLSDDALVIKVLQAIRKRSATQLIFGGESISSISVSQAFKADENIFAVTPHSPQLVNDEGYAFNKNYNKKYGQSPDWYGTHSYDAAMVICNSLPKLDKNIPIEKIRQQLMKNMKKIHYGLTGRLDYRTKNYPTQKDINVAYIRANQWQPAPQQLLPVYDPNTITKLEDEIKNGYVIFDTEDYYRVVNIVYAGTAVKSISELNLSDKSCVVEFFLWFRHMPANKSADMLYLSSLGDPVLKAYVNRTEKKSQVQLLTDPKQTNHVLYKIKQKFALDTVLLGDYEYLKYAHTIGLSLRPNLDPQQSIRLVTDTAILDQKPRIDEMGWEIAAMESYVDTMNETTFGNPRFEKDTNIAFSRFNTKIVLDTIHIFPALNISEKTGFWILLISSFIFILSFIMTYLAGITRLLSFLAMSFSSQTLFFAYAGRNIEFLHLKPLIVIGFDIGSWLIAAYAVTLWVRVKYFKRIEDETHMPVPHLLKMLIYTLIGTTTASCIIGFVFRYPITGLITSGGFFVAVIGFAIQQNLSHIFSGLMLNIEKPFRIGDWVKLGPETGNLTGKILDVTWRSTRVLTIQNNVISVPNSKIGESLIENFNYPDDFYVHTFELLLDRNHNPDEVMKVMKAAVTKDKLVLDFDLQPKRIEDENMVYMVFVSASDYDKSRLIVWGEVLSKVWKALKDAGLYTVKMKHFVQEGDSARVIEKDI